MNVVINVIDLVVVFVPAALVWYAVFALGTVVVTSRFIEEYVSSVDLFLFIHSKAL